MCSWYRDQGYTTYLNLYVSISITRGGGQLEKLFNSLSICGSLLFSNSSNIFISVCVWRYIFISLPYIFFLDPKLILAPIWRQTIRANRGFTNLKVISWRQINEALIFLGILDDVAHKLKSLFNSNLNFIYTIRQLFISRKFSLEISISKILRPRSPLVIEGGPLM